MSSVITMHDPIPAGTVSIPAVPAGSGRDMSAILRDGLTGRLHPREQAIPGGALPFVAGEVIGAYATTRGRPDDAATAGAWLCEYARLLLPDVPLAFVIGLTSWETVQIIKKGANYGYSLREGPQAMTPRSRRSSARRIVRRRPRSPETWKGRSRRSAVSWPPDAPYSKPTADSCSGSTSPASC